MTPDTSPPHVDWTTVLTGTIAAAVAWISGRLMLTSSLETKVSQLLEEVKALRKDVADLRDRVSRIEGHNAAKEHHT